MPDEVIFSGKYKDLDLSIRFDLSKKKESDVAYCLEYIKKQIESFTYSFVKVDTKKIDSFAKLSSKGLGAVAEFFEKNSQSTIKKTLETSLVKPELLPLAETYLLNKLFSEAGISLQSKSKSDLKAQKYQSEEEISFIGKYGKWFAAKKLGLENIEDYQVSGVLCGIIHTLTNKAFDFDGSQINDKLIDEATKGKRKNYKSLAEVFRFFEQKPFDPVSIVKSLEKINYYTYPTPGLLTDAYEDIKPPRVKGRKPKG